MNMDAIVIYGVILLYGIVIGSFLNVCIYRIPNKTNIALGRSHCMGCDTDIKLYDLIPVISFLLLRGKCRACKSEISIQYPIIEALNGILYVAVFHIYGWNGLATVLLNVVYCMVISLLLVISVIDMRTQLIPNVLNLVLVLFGVLAVIIVYVGSNGDWKLISEYFIGFFAISFFLYLIFYITGGRGIGGGDVKLMAGAGLLLGWKLVIVAFLIGAISAAIIHPILMRVKKVGRVMAFGPYLALGIVCALFFGERIVNWYIGYMGF